jgi:hypothetical protein
MARIILGWIFLSSAFFQNQQWMICAFACNNSRWQGVACAGRRSAGFADFLIDL